MAQNKVMNLWTAFVTAFLALCTALGLITTTASAAVQQTGTTRNSATETATATAISPEFSPWSYVRSLPPTMKQRIRAEAHGKTPSCRHRPPADKEADTEAAQGTAQSTAHSSAQGTGQDTAQNAAAGSTAPETPVQDTTAARTTLQHVAAAQGAVQDTTPCAPAVSAVALRTPLHH